jgi:hypothetical protein
MGKVQQRGQTHGAVVGEQAKQRGMAVDGKAKNERLGGLWRVRGPDENAALGEFKGPDRGIFGVRERISNGLIFTGGLPGWGWLVERKHDVAVELALAERV